MIGVWIWIYHAKIMLQHVALYFISSTANVREHLGHITYRIDVFRGHPSCTSTNRNRSNSNAYSCTPRKFIRLFCSYLKLLWIHINLGQPRNAATQLQQRLDAFQNFHVGEANLLDKLQL